MKKTTKGVHYSRASCLAAHFLEHFFPRPPFRIANGIQAEGPSILLIELFGLGDLASLSVLFDPILKKYPQAKIYIVCQEWCQGLYGNDSRVSKVYGIPTPWKASARVLFSPSAWKKVFQAASALRAISIDWAIDTRGDVRSQIFARWVKPKRLVAPLDYMGSNMILRGALLSDILGVIPHGHRYQRNCDCLLPILGMPVEASLPSLPLKSNNVSLGTLSRLLIHTGGGWRYKHWPEGRWQKLLLDLLDKKEWEIAILCAPGEERIVERISEGTSVKIERPSFKDLLPTIQSYHAMVATDSGPINLAILSGIPVVDIMGPGDSIMWGPPPGRGILLQEVGNYPCYPCRQRKCFFPSNPCVEQVTFEKLKSALKVLKAQIHIKLGC
jgi:ADP-heptose:LPS heptosyltransferase